jgi:formylglycine-generating enzyme required for sulfatase activity/outer membrane protein assembly factor BamB
MRRPAGSRAVKKLIGWCLCGLLLGCGQRAPVETPPAVEPAPAATPRFLTNSIGMKLARIPAGEFEMGASEGDDEAAEDEKPRHRVRITRPFYMGVYEVTQEEYRRVTGSSSSFFSPTGAGKERVAGLDTSRFPAEQIRWPDAVEFCRRLSELPAERQAGRVYRLPTEAEWEYACRAGTKTRFHFGDSLSSRQANFNGNHPCGQAARGPFVARTCPVGSYPANAFGLRDMHGNVWEWCADWYARHYYQNSPVDDPPGPESGSMKVIRGGEWYAEGRDCRSSFRYADLPRGVFYVMGFRVVMTTDGSVVPARPVVEVEAKPAVALAPEQKPLGGGEDWPQWRGPRRDGTWRGPDLPQRWPETGLRCRWRQPIGGGYSGIAVADGRACTLDRIREPEERERVLCCDAATGALLWSHAYPVSYGQLPYGNGPRSTPTVHDGRVYALGALGHLHCLDARTGQPIWSTHLVADQRASRPGWGFAASPVIFEDLVILHAGGEPDACLIAFDRHSGKVAWRSLPDPGGYATPVLARTDAGPQLVCWTETNIHGLEPATGKVLWSIPFQVTYGTAIASPIAHDGLVFVSGYYEGSKAIRLGPEATRAELAWENRRSLAGVMSTPLYRAGHGYLLDRRAGLVCFDWTSGQKLWDDANRATPKGRNSHASLVWLGDAGRALILNSDGELILAHLSPAGYQEMSRTAIIGATWAHPAFAGDCVFARSDQEIVCVSLREAAGP